MFAFLNVIPVVFVNKNFIQNPNKQILVDSFSLILVEKETLTAPKQNFAYKSVIN